MFVFVLMQFHVLLYIVIFHYQCVLVQFVYKHNEEFHIHFHQIVYELNHLLKNKINQYQVKIVLFQVIHLLMLHQLDKFFLLMIVNLYDLFHRLIILPFFDYHYLNFHYHYHYHILVHDFFQLLLNNSLLNHLLIHIYQLYEYWKFIHG